MGDMKSIFKDYRDAQKEQRMINLQESVDGIDWKNMDFGENLMMVRQSDYHFQLFHKRDGWILDIWPSTQRLRSGGKIRAPFIEVPRPWTIKEVIDAAKKTTK
jgi:hypothetical protein